MGGSEQLNPSNQRHTHTHIQDGRKGYPQNKCCGKIGTDSSPARGRKGNGRNGLARRRQLALLFQRAQRAASQGSPALLKGLHNSPKAPKAPLARDPNSPMASPSTPRAHLQRTPRKERGPQGKCSRREATSAPKAPLELVLFGG